MDVVGGTVVQCSGRGRIKWIRSILETKIIIGYSFLITIINDKTGKIGEY